MARLGHFWFILRVRLSGQFFGSISVSTTDTRHPKEDSGQWSLLAVGHPLFSTDFPKIYVYGSSIPISPRRKKIEMQIKIWATYCWDREVGRLRLRSLFQRGFTFTVNRTCPKLQVDGGQFSDSKREWESRTWFCNKNRDRWQKFVKVVVKRLAEPSRAKANKNVCQGAAHISHMMRATEWMHLEKSFY